MFRTALLALALVLMLSPSAHAVFGGIAADTRQFQFVRYLEITLQDGRQGGCTGTLLERGLILTAAHCVIDRSNRRMKKIVVKRKRSDTAGEEAFAAYVHPEFRYDGEYLNDIAILYTMLENEGHASLPVDYAWSRFKAANRKPYYPTFLSQLTAGDLREIFGRSIPRDPGGQLWAYIVGFGLTCPEDKCPTLPNTARYVGKPIYPMGKDGYCKRTEFDFKTAPQRFCAFTEDAPITRASVTDGKSNSNFGDSGGPMFSFDRDGTAVVIGIVNAGNSSFGMFTSVYDQVEFLRNSLNMSRGDKIRAITFGVGSSDSAEAKVEDGLGLKETVPLVRQLLEKYGHEASGARMGSAVRDLWADEVILSGKAMRREQLTAQLDALSARWRQRLFHMTRVLKTSSCSGDECTVVGTVGWSLYRGETGRQDTSVFTWVLRRQGPGWRFVSEAQRAHTRADEE